MSKSYDDYVNDLTDDEFEPILQSYLNWFIYLQRVKKQQDKWGKSSRIMRHLLLNDSKYTRKY